MKMRKNPRLQVVQSLRHGDGRQLALWVDGKGSACKLARSKDDQRFRRPDYWEQKTPGTPCAFIYTQLSLEFILSISTLFKRPYHDAEFASYLSALRYVVPGPSGREQSGDRHGQVCPERREIHADLCVNACPTASGHASGDNMVLNLGENIEVHERGCRDRSFSAWVAFVAESIHQPS